MRHLAVGRALAPAFSAPLRAGKVRGMNRSPPQPSQRKTGMSGIRMGTVPMGIIPLPSVESAYLIKRMMLARAVRRPSGRVHAAPRQAGQPFGGFPWAAVRQSARSSGWEWTPNFWKIALR